MVAYILLSLPGFAQTNENSLDFINQKFFEYQKTHLQEKIFIHTSKNSFLVGETIYFNVFCVDGYFHRPLGMSKVVYVEMIDANNQPVEQIKVELIDGLGSGTIQIPQVLATGTFKLIAYTSWMRNFDVSYFFSLEIGIVNPQQAALKKTSVSAAKPKLRFFPEGGDFVIGLESKVAFQATNERGEALSIRGYIKDQVGTVVTEFATFRFGLGTFQLTPKSDCSYQAIVEYNEKLYTFPLPAALPRGYTLSLIKDANHVKVLARSTLDDDHYKKTFMFIQSRGRFVKSVMLEFNEHQYAELLLSPDELKDGIHQVTLFDTNLKPVAERLFFVQPKELLEIKTTFDKPRFKAREKVALEIETTLNGVNGIGSNLSLSIFKLDEWQRYDSCNIASYFLLASDLQGKIHNQSYYLYHPNQEERELAVDNLMLTQGWRRFVWNTITSEKAVPTPFIPEHEGLIVKTLVHNNSNQIKPLVPTLMSTGKNNEHLYGVISNARGQSIFYTRKLYGTSQLVFQALESSEPSYFSIISPFTSLYPTDFIKDIEINHGIIEQIKQHSIYSQLNNGIYPSLMIKPENIGGSLFGKSDKIYNTDDYVKFPTLKEVIVEYISNVTVRKRNDKSSLFVYDKLSEKYFETEPLILVDGTPVMDSEKIISLPGNSIKQIEIYNKKFYLGSFVMNGIISLVSTTGKFDGIQLNPEAIVYDFEGLQLRREFYAPDYLEADQVNSRLPDFRNVLMWSQLKTNTTGKATLNFTTSDLRGKFIGVINGLSDGGLAGTTAFVFDVE